MRSLKEDSVGEGRNRAGEYGEEGPWLVPAGNARVVLGLAMMLGGFLLWKLSDGSWLSWVGLGPLISSGAVMLKSPENRR